MRWKGLVVGEGGGAALWMTLCNNDSWRWWLVATTIGNGGTGPLSPPISTHQPITVETTRFGVGIFILVFLAIRLRDKNHHVNRGGKGIVVPPVE
jgi:hypothetical protein